MCCVSFLLVLHISGNHGIIASKRCDHLLVKDNLSYDNDGSGIMLHKSCDDSIVSGRQAFPGPGGGGRGPRLLLALVRYIHAASLIAYRVEIGVFIDPIR